ncbi:aldehyde dehydrogenase family protein [Alkalicoccus halolimnae]|uniref:Aldehyde dehydrogenase family protein n=1 Tax=Alkalicoccus halolimnae TaxID=1667239 RepID=A0A5C7F7F1_9BACI|nr:aldehyde dehydrogenase family protein [Alkalicoccus halolimnae]TXF85328.1 aldehyde dehydrogenase family protein [Alkalicoccus halolimnae]
MSVIQTQEILNQFINGEWISPESAPDAVINPATKEVISYTGQGSDEDVGYAIDSAHEASLSWKKTAPPQRGAYLEKAASILLERKQEFAISIVREMGKTYAEAMKEVEFSAGILNFYGGEGRRLTGKIIASDMPNIQIETKPEPLGVILAVTPWNFPLSIPCWKSAPALVSGNTVLLKTSSETPVTATKLMEVFEEAGIPGGVINHLIIPGNKVSSIIESDKVNAVSFTGSNQVGAKIHEAAGRQMKRVHLEMGGKNPLLVMEDANLDEAVDLAVKGGFGQAGQACTATGRVIVHEKVKKEFLRKLIEETEKISVGNGLEDGVTMGPQVNQQELDSTFDLIKSAEKEGAKIVTGGKALTEGDYADGFYVSPTVIDQVNHQMRIAQEEVFGPVIAVFEASSIDEAIQLANATDYGLTASICTKNIDYMTQAFNDIEAGLVKANMPTTGTFFQAPFGGYKSSGLGTFKELGREALDFYNQYKTRYIKTD